MKTEFIDIISGLSDENLWLLYGYSINELYDRKLIRTRNITGERGEFLAIEYYKKAAGFPVLQAAPAGTRNVDALSRNGERYAIKTITLPNKTTGTFHGISENVKDMKFEYLIIVIIDKNFQLNKILELTWEQFFNFKKWHSTMKSWNINLTNDIIDNSKIIFESKTG